MALVTCGPLSWGVLLAVLLIDATAKTQSHDVKLNSPVAAVEGNRFDEEDLLPAIGAQLPPPRSQEFGTKMKALNELIQRTVTESAAKKKGVRTEQLLAQEVEAKDGELEASDGAAGAARLREAASRGSQHRSSAIRAESECGLRPTARAWKCRCSCRDC
jgi:hypothetical protein